jgi:hypothetical protein
MTKDIFVKLDIKEQVELINSRTITGLNIIEVAQEIGMSESAIRRIMKKNNYTYNRVEKIYLLSSNNMAITKEEPQGNKGIKVEEPKVVPLQNSDKAPKPPTNTTKDPQKNNEGIRVEESNNSYFTKEEVRGLKELLAAKELLLSIGGITGNNNGINILEGINLDRSNRKKATFNMDISLLDQLKAYENKSNINKSDIINIALNEYLKTRE